MATDPPNDGTRPGWGSPLGPFVGEIKIWDTQAGKEIRTLKRIPGWLLDLDFSPDGKRLAVVTPDGQAVQLWDLAALPKASPESDTPAGPAAPTPAPASMPHPGPAPAAAPAPVPKAAPAPAPAEPAAVEEWISKLGREKVKDADLAGLSKLTGLRNLNLDMCSQVTDAGLNHLKRLTNLETLLLRHGQRVTDAGLQELQKALPKLRAER